MGVAAAGGGLAIMAGSAAAATAGLTTFYRGVSSLEAAQISADGVMKAIGGLKVQSTSRIQRRQRSNGVAECMVRVPGWLK